VAASRGVARFAVHVRDGHEDLERFVLHGLAAERKKRLQNVVRLFPARGGTREFAVVLALRVAHEEVFPDLQAAGYVGPAAGVDPQPRGQQHHIVLERNTGRAGPGLVILPRTAA